MSLLLEISHSVNVDTFMHHVRGALSAMREGNNAAASIMSKTGDVKTAKMQLKRPQTVWFTKNFPSIKSVAYSLRNSHPIFDKIANIATTAYKSDSVHANPEMSKSAGFEQFVNSIETAAKYLKQEHVIQQLRDIEQERANILRGMDSSSSTPSKSARVVDTDSIERGQDEVKGQQAQKVEQIVNQTISTLPDKYQHQARRAVAQSGNKLLALHNFMKQHGL